MSFFLLDDFHIAKKRQQSNQAKYCNTTCYGVQFSRLLRRCHTGFIHFSSRFLLLFCWIQKIVQRIRSKPINQLKGLASWLSSRILQLRPCRFRLVAMRLSISFASRVNSSGSRSSQFLCPASRIQEFDYLDLLSICVKPCLSPAAAGEREPAELLRPILSDPFHVFFPAGESSLSSDQ